MQPILGVQMIQEQTQKLIMNQEMRQAISILQYSSAELTSFIEQQLETNPFFDVDRARFHTSHNLSSTHIGNSGARSSLDHITRNHVSLEQSLLEQLAFQKLQPNEVKIATYLIGMLDSDGYLREDLQQVAFELRVDVPQVEAMLALIQTFEPIGVGARSLSECLLLQLRHQEEVTPLVEEVITHHLPELAERKFSFLAQKFATTDEEIKSILERIERLHPRPGSIHFHSEVNYIIPDLYVELIDGQLQLHVNERVYPQLAIDTSFQQFVKQNMDDASKAYIKEHLRNAHWLIRNLEQRKQTIIKVTKAIFAHQFDFLFFGTDALQPLTLQQVAQQIGVHESTVSRATNQKYVQTPKGLYELKSFFVHGISTANGTKTTPYPIKKRIEEIIRAEDKTRPLSDQQITEQLLLEGIQISRRTVMKYREELHIPSSSKRRSRI